MTKDELREKLREICEDNWSGHEYRGGEADEEAIDAILNLLEGEKQKARESALTIVLHTMKDTFRRLWMYEVIYGGVKDMDNRDVAKEFEEYQKLEPTRQQFADWYEAKLATLNKEPNKGEDVDG